jgi:MFS family permease
MDVKAAMDVASRANAAVESRMNADEALENTLLAVYITCGVDLLGQGFTVSMMPFYVLSLGGDAAGVGLIISTWAAGHVVSSIWMGMASDWLGRKPIMIVSLISSAVGFLLTALAWDMRTLFMARLFLGLTSGTMPVGQSYIAEVVKPRERAKKMANLGALNGLAMMVGPPVGSLIAATNFGLRVRFTLAASAPSPPRLSPIRTSSRKSAARAETILKSSTPLPTAAVAACVCRTSAVPMAGS